MDMIENTGKVHKASALHKELQESKECGELKKYSSPGMSTPIGYTMPNDQP